jgi:hypothetical protein
MDDCASHGRSDRRPVFKPRFDHFPQDRYANRNGRRSPREISAALRPFVRVVPDFFRFWSKFGPISLVPLGTPVAQTPMGNDARM